MAEPARADPAAEPPVLVAYDGSDPSRVALDRAADLFPGRRALVLSVWESIAAAAPAGLIAIPAGVARRAYEELDEAARRRSETLVEEGAQRLRSQGMHAEAVARLCHGNVWSTIVDTAAAEDVAAVVVGSRGLSGVKGALLGSVSAGVVHHAGRPVLVVPAAEP